MNQTLLKIINLVIGYPGHALGFPITVEIPKGASVGIIGANGTGKSTLVKTLAGLVPPLKGQYQWVKEANSPEIRFGYVPQEDQLSPLFPLTVLDVLNMGRYEALPKFKMSLRDFEIESLAGVLQEMDIEPFQSRLFSDLSRGQRQRVLIARALIGNPHVLLLDEPYSALDDSFRIKLHDVFARRKKKMDFSFFIIEHDLNRVMNQVDWMIILGPQETLCGPKSEIMTQESLTRAYGAKIHLHKKPGEKDEIQIHFL